MKNALRDRSADRLELLHQQRRRLSRLGHFPNEYAARPTMDGVVCYWASLPGSNYVPVQRRRHRHSRSWPLAGSLSHFPGWLYGSNDGVADTPAERGPTFGCPTRNLDTCKGPSNPGLDPYENFMDYTDDPCMYKFTRGQADRADTMWATYRAGN